MLAAGVCVRICIHSVAKTFGQRPGVKKGSRETIFSPWKNIKNRLKLYSKYKDWRVEDWCIFSLMTPPSDWLGYLENRLSEK